MNFHIRRINSGARQLTNRQPTNQKTSKINEPTYQEANKPIKNQPKINQNQSKIDQSRFLGALGRPGAQEPKNPRRRIRGPFSGPAPGPPSEAHNRPKSGKIGSKSDLKGHHFFDWLCGRVLVPFGTNLGPTWPPKPSQNRFKLVSKSIKKGIQMLTKFLLHFSSLWGRSCVNFPSKLEGRGSQKY